MCFQFARIFIFIAALASTLSINAKAHYTALLHHGNDVTAFSGDSALIRAAAGATAGDIIYLSEGNFKGVEITAPIKLYGAGEYTTIQKLTLNIPASESETYIEGINVKGDFRLPSAYNVKFQRCKFNGRFSENDKNNADNVLFKQCYIDICEIVKIERLVIENCKLGSIYNQNSWINQDVKVLPIVKNSHIDGDWTQKGITFGNCTIKKHNTYSPSNEKSYLNCVLGFTAPEQCRAQDCTTLSESDFTALFKDKNTLELNDAAAATYKGDDGTQVGMYGGQFPYTLIPATPVVTRAAHPMSPTADGKLPFEATIEIRN